MVCPRFNGENSQVSKPNPKLPLPEEGYGRHSCLSAKRLQPPPTLTSAFSLSSLHYSAISSVSVDGCNPGGPPRGALVLPKHPSPPSGTMRLQEVSVLPQRPQSSSAWSCPTIRQEGSTGAKLALTLTCNASLPPLRMAATLQIHAAGPYRSPTDWATWARQVLLEVTPLTS